MVSSEQIKRKFVDLKKSHRKKRCGCIETRVLSLGSIIWIQDFELMCKKHRDEHKKEFAANLKKRVVATTNSSKKLKNKRRRKKDEVETDA